MALVEEAARSVLAEHGVRLDDLSVPSQFQEATEWTLVVVAEVGPRIVGTARLSELARDLVSLDQMSVDPAYGGRGIGRELLLVAAEAARELGCGAITGKPPSEPWSSSDPSTRVSAESRTRACSGGGRSRLPSVWIGSDRA